MSEREIEQLRRGLRRVIENLEPLGGDDDVQRARRRSA
jgi:hypothetical protein